MVRRVQRRFWCIAMVSMGLCLIALIAVINLVQGAQTDREMDRVLEEMVETVEAARGYHLAAEAEPEWRVESYVEEETVTPSPEASPSAQPEETREETREDTWGPEDQWAYNPGPKGKGGHKLPWWYQDLMPAESSETPAPTAGTEAETETVIHHYYYYYPQETGESLRDSAMNQYSGRLCVVSFQEGAEPQVGMSDSSALSTEAAAALAGEMLRQGKTSGDLDAYRYQVRTDGEAVRVYFLDCSTELDSRRSLLLISILVGLGGLVVTGIFVYGMSVRATAPLTESMEKQKRFITDAGHELKTPLAVIGTNMDILEMDLGENEWISGTKKQLVRLRKLVANLISLSRMEEQQQTLELQRFCLSDTALECVDAFSGAAELAGKELLSQLQPELYIRGDVTSVGQLLTILCDNAVKYARGPIQVRLYAKGKHVVFETENPWERTIPPAELDRLFDRFYRADAARAATEGKSGYGLGLSIARAIAEKNRAQLTAEETPSGDLLFRASFHREKQG